MSEGVKKLCALILLTSWVLLSGICFSEEFGYFNDGPEHEDQTIERAFSIPAERVSISSELRETLNAARAAASSLLNPFLALPFFSLTILFVVLSTFEYFRPPGKYRLLAVLSILRI